MGEISLLEKEGNHFIEKVFEDYEESGNGRTVRFRKTGKIISLDDLTFLKSARVSDIWFLFLIADYLANAVRHAQEINARYVLLENVGKDREYDIATAIYFRERKAAPLNKD